jgi:hypothetical protein
MAAPIWITADNLGIVKNQTYLEKSLQADNAISYTLTAGSLPSGLTLSEDGIISGTVDLETIIANTKYYASAFTITARAADNSTTAKTFTITVVLNYYSYIDNRIDRVRYSGNNLEYTIFKGQTRSLQNIIWRFGSGNKPNFISINSAGTIVSNFTRAILPLRREQFLNDINNTSPSVNIDSWNAWLSNFLKSPKEYDYQFTVELTNGVDEIYQSYTVRIFYTKITSEESWFNENQNLVSFDTDQYYFFFGISDRQAVDWTSSRDLGLVTNGSVSELAVNASTDVDNVLEYYVKPAYESIIPQGISLLKNGLLSGRFSFRCHVDDPATVPVDDRYQFTVRAETSDGFNFSEQQFNLKIVRLYDRPYDNIWIRSFPQPSLRAQLLNLINNEELFPSELIYRINDPWFGKTGENLRFLFAAGLNASSVDVYASAVTDITARKIVTLSEVKTAVCLDSNNNVKYEVVYLEVQENTSLTIYTPKTLTYMRQRLEQVIGTIQPILPDWMASIQPVDAIKYSAPLGFINAVVLAYTVPGASDLIKYRINSKKINFNIYPFEFDRYELDDNQNTLYNLTSNNYSTGVETQFDSGITVFEDGATRFIDNGDIPIPVPTDARYGDKYIKFPIDGVIV